MLVHLLTILPTWLYHIVEWPMNTGANGGYNFWSGIGSGSPILVGVVVYWRKHNCHIHRCWRLQWHTHPDHGHPVCKHHHSDGKIVADSKPSTGLV